MKEKLEVVLGINDWVLKLMYYEFFFIFFKEWEFFESFFLDVMYLVLEELSLESLKVFDDKEIIEFIS